jgi:hypothetical protein
MQNYDYLIDLLLKKNDISEDIILSVKNKICNNDIINMDLLHILYSELREKVISCFFILISKFNEEITREEKINDFLYFINNEERNNYIKEYKEIIFSSMSEEEIIISFIYLKIIFVENKNILSEEEKYFVNILCDVIYNMKKYLIKVKCQTCDNIIFKNQIKNNLNLMGNHILPYSCRNCKQRHLSIRDSIFNTINEENITDTSSFLNELQKSIENYIEKQNPNEIDKNILSLMYHNTALKSSTSF